MILSESAEEMLEALWLEYEANKRTDCVLSKLRESPDARTLKELSDAGIIVCKNPDHASVTEKGLAEARDAIRRHRLAERLLTDVLSVKGELMHDTACQFEHHLHKGIDVSVCTLLGHPKVCPHGKPIPPGRCCEEESKTVKPAVSPLSSLKPGDLGQIAYLYTADPKRAQMLISMGVIPGADVKLLAGFPSFLFELGESQFAIDGDVAREIYVRRNSAA